MDTTILLDMYMCANTPWVTPCATSSTSTLVSANIFILELPSQSSVELKFISLSCPKIDLVCTESLQKHESTTQILCSGGGY